MKGDGTMNDMAMNNMAVINELNKVEGFNPAVFLRKLVAENGEEQFYLDVKYRKLWFRLKYPEGKITKRIVKLDNDFAIIESKIYLNRTDPEDAYISSAMAQRWRTDDDNYGNKYVETAETAAVGRALADAGFGIQFSEPGEDKDLNIVDSPVSLPQEFMQDDELPLPEENEPVKEETNASAPNAVPTQKKELDDSMSVEELMSYISVEEAKKMVVPFGRYKGSLMGEVCVNDPKSIRWIVDSYKGNRNIIRAAAKVLLNAVE